MFKFPQLTVLILPFFLVACASQPQPPQEKPEQETTTEESQPSVNTSKVNETASAPQAVFSLIERSLQQLHNENFKGAASSLERAIRIAPRYPNSYYYLAEVRHLEGRNAQAQSLAKKALSLGAQDALLESVLVLLDKIHESER